MALAGDPPELQGGRPRAAAITPDGLSAWLEQFWRGALRPVHRSEIAPPVAAAAQPGGGVEAAGGAVGAMRLTGRTISQALGDRSRDLLLAVVRNGCPHCTALLPVFDELARSSSGGNPPLVGPPTTQISRRYYIHPQVHSLTKHV